MDLFIAPCKRIHESWILYLKPWFTNSMYWIPDFFSVELGLKIPIVSGMPDSLSCIPDSKAQDSGFH